MVGEEPAIVGLQERSWDDANVMSEKPKYIDRYLYEEHATISPTWALLLCVISAFTSSHSRISYCYSIPNNDIVESRISKTSLNNPHYR